MNFQIVLFTILALGLALWGLLKLNENGRWTTTCCLLGALAMVRGGLEVYKTVNHLVRGSFHHAVGDFIGGIMVGIAITVALTHTTKHEAKEQAPPGQGGTMDVGTAFIELVATRLTSAKARINHCLDQIDAGMLWSAPEGSNSVGVILQHLEGNLRQWVMSALGGEPDTRERSKEFMVAARQPLDAARASINQTVDGAISTYRGLAASRLLDAVAIQGMQQTVMSAMFNTVCHLELHAGQITYLTKQLLRSRYKEYWKPQTKEQGA